MIASDVILLLVLLLMVILLWIGRQARIVCEQVEAERLAMEKADRPECERKERQRRCHRRFAR